VLCFSHCEADGEEAGCFWMTASVWGPIQLWGGMADDLYGGERIRGEDFGVFLVGFLDDKGMGGEEDGDLLWVLAEIWWLWDVKAGLI
jgi:hypothetical protein